MKKIYSFDEIKRSVTCEAYLATQGIELDRSNRCAATWRGGDGANVSCDGSNWYDHRMKTGGSVIDLCMLVQGLTMLQAVSFLGDRFNVAHAAEIKQQKRPRYYELIAEGYTCQAEYRYCDENGVLQYVVLRMVHASKPKEFVQKRVDPDGTEHWGRGNSVCIPYRLQEVIAAQQVFIVEGEKDADTLAKLGIVATTNTGGAKNWDPNQNRYFSGKDVVVLADNDDAGREHAQVVQTNVQLLAKSFRVLTPSKLPKGDVTDWIEQEGGSAEKLMELLNHASDERSEGGEQEALQLAKLSNQEPFANYVVSSTAMVGAGSRKKKVHTPIQMRELINGIKKRFLNFPRRIGESLFDWNKDKNKIVFIENTNALFAWIQRLSGQQVLWSGVEGMVRREELFYGIFQDALHYESIGAAPHYPTRDNVFYVHPKLPPPDPTCSAFYRLLDFFLPANAEYKLLLRVLFLAPLYHRSLGNKPAWIIDSVGGQGAGKTTIAKKLAMLYGEEYIDIDINELKTSYDQVAKRLVSADGRTKRIALYDNVTGVIKCENLSKLITSSSVSTRGAYSKNEDTRVNDITHIITANGATTDTDIARRAFVIKLAQAPRDPLWERRVDDFIRANRLQIYADMLLMLERNPIQLDHGMTRYSDFETTVMTAACSSEEEYRAMMKRIQADSETVNMDEDNANEFLELFKDKLAGSNNLWDKEPNTASVPIFVEASVIDLWLQNSSGELKNAKTATIRRLIASNTLKGFSKYVEKFPPVNMPEATSKRGILWLSNQSLIAGQPINVMITRRAKGGKLDYVVSYPLIPNQGEP